MEYFELRNGIMLSCIGMGTFSMRADQLIRTIPFVSQLGINLIDSAHDYKNEMVIGIASKLVQNKNVHLSTKMSVSQQKRGGVYYYIL